MDNANQTPNFQQPGQPYQQPGYQPNYSQQTYVQYQQYQQYPPYQPVNQTRPNGMAIAAMVLGICSIFFSAGAITGLVCAILALVFAGKVKKQTPGELQSPNRGFVLAAKICGIVGLVFSILFLILWIIHVIALVYIIQEATPYFINELAPYLNGRIDIQISSASMLF